MSSLTSPYTQTDTPASCSFLNVKDNFSHPCKRTGKIATPCSLIFIFSGRSGKDTCSVPNCSRCSLNIICSYFHACNFDLLVCIPNIWSCHICKRFKCYLLYCIFPAFCCILRYNNTLNLQRVKLPSVIYMKIQLAPRSEHPASAKKPTVLSPL